MRLRTREASWFVSGLVLVTVVLSAGLGVVVAQPRSETPRAALDTSEATFEVLGEHLLVNTNNVAFTSQEDGFFDIFFSCSSTRGTDPLRLRDAKDISRAKAYFNDEKRHGRHFVKINKYCINVRNIGFIQFRDDVVVINFNARVMDAFLQVALSGADAENFRKKWRDF